MWDSCVESCRAHLQIRLFMSSYVHTISLSTHLAIRRWQEVEAQLFQIAKEVQRAEERRLSAFDDFHPRPNSSLLSSDDDVMDEVAELNDNSDDDHADSDTASIRAEYVSRPPTAAPETVEEEAAHAEQQSSPSNTAQHASNDLKPGSSYDLTSRSLPGGKTTGVSSSKPAPQATPAQKPSPSPTAQQQPRPSNATHAASEPSAAAPPVYTSAPTLSNMDLARVAEGPDRVRRAQRTSLAESSATSVATLPASPLLDRVASTQRRSSAPAHSPVQRQEHAPAPALGLAQAQRPRKLAPVTPVAMPGGHDAGVTCFAVLEGGYTLASGGDDQQIILWDPASGRHRGALKGFRDGVAAVVGWPHRADLLIAASDRDVSLWHIPSGDRWCSLQVGPFSAISKKSYRVVCHP